MGVLFLTTWYSNLSKGFYTYEGLEVFFTSVFPTTENPITWYADFINNIIMPSRQYFAPFQLVTEFLMGLFLLVGFITPLTSLGAGFFILNTFLLTYGHDWVWSYFTIIGILAVVFLTKAGRSLGIDSLLFRAKGEPPVPFIW